MSLYIKSYSSLDLCTSGFYLSLFINSRQQRNFGIKERLKGPNTFPFCYRDLANKCPCLLEGMALWSAVADTNLDTGILVHKHSTQLAVLS